MNSEKQSTSQSELPNEHRLLPASTSVWIPLLHLAFAILLFYFLVPYEWDRVQSENQDLPLLTRFFLHVNVDTTPYFILLLLSPLCWFFRPYLNFPFFSKTLRPRLSQEWVREKQASRKCDYSALFLCIIVSSSSFLMSSWTSSHIVNQELNLALGDLPPAYHDEFSYLFQTKTFLAGRTWFPSHPDVPEIFDQVHVLNEGKMASRYFPGTGLWLAPFVAWGHPYWGYWLAGAITACFIFWSGRELGGNGVGFLAGLVIALSPGMAIFSNLLLAHHPTLVGLSIFLWLFLRMQRTRSFCNALLAGLGLTFAMLCRPMTAAGFALPFGIWLVFLLIRSSFQKRDETKKSAPDKLRPPRPAWVLVAGLAIPIGSGLTGLFFYNQSITGSGWKMPYQVYTDIYTPRHVYGFNNVIRGEQKLGPKVLHNYDTWAKNLTPELAIQNVQNRFLASLQWTLGLIPLGLAGLIFLITEFRYKSRWWLVFASIVSLHIVHIPYWYDGIMHWHYIFETGPLWALIFARVTQTLFRIWNKIERPLMSLLWISMILVAVLTNLTSISPMWTSSKLETEINSIAFSKLKQFQFLKMVEQHPLLKKPALILIAHDPADRHIDYVINAPQLNQPVLLGRYRPELYEPNKLQTLFANRQIYLFDVAQNRLSRWNGVSWEPI